MAQARASWCVPARQAVLDAAELIIGDTTGLDPDQRAHVDRPQSSAARARQSDAPRARCRCPSTDLAAKYVALAIDCEQPKLIESVDMNALLATLRGRAVDAVPPVDVRPPGRAEASARCAQAIRAGPTRLYWEGRRELASSLGRAIDLPKVISAVRAGPRGVPGVGDADDGVGRTRT